MNVIAMPPFRRQKQSPELSDRLVLGIASSSLTPCLPFTPRNDSKAVDGEIVFGNPKKVKEAAQAKSNLSK